MKHFKRRHIDWSEDWYVPEPNSGCWLWLGPVGRTGYAKIDHDSDISMSVAHAAMLDCERASILASGGFDD